MKTNTQGDSNNHDSSEDFPHQRKERLLFFASITLITGVVWLTWVGEISGIRLPYLNCIGVLFLFVSSAYFYGVLKRLSIEFASVDEQKVDLLKRNEILYGKSISFLGFVIILLSLTNAIILSGFLYHKVISIPFAETGTKINVETGGMILMVSMLMAVLGSVFFTTNRLLRMRDKDQEDFSKDMFWSGLCFRMGESILFVLVLFLLLCSEKERYLAYINWLPAFSLLMGMFVKSGERLIFGIAERLFEMARGLLPTTEKLAERTIPGAPRNLEVATLPNNELELKWDEPVSGGQVQFYKIFSPVDKQEGFLIGETHQSTRFLKFKPLKKFEGKLFVKAGNNAGEGEKSNVVVMEEENEENAEENAGRP